MLESEIKLFESSVILEGSKTTARYLQASFLFESSVILEGSKTPSGRSRKVCRFESSVILEGSKTFFPFIICCLCLRVVLF